MRYLLDTCVISETRKRHPDSELMQWLSKVRPADLYLSAVTIGELRSGARSVRALELRPQLERWIEDRVIPSFQGRIAAFDFDAANHWGVIFGDGVASGRTPSVCDSMIAAIAISQGMVLVTRNVSDFNFPNLEVINPFEPIP